jgi:hypothetical protein
METPAYYESSKAHGVLHRDILKSSASWHSFWNLKPPTDSEPTIWKTFLEHIIVKCKLEIDKQSDAWKHRIKEAWNIQAAYERSMRDITFQFPGNPFQPLTEFEVLLGFIAREGGGHTRRGKHLQEELERLWKWTELLIRGTDSEVFDKETRMLRSIACLEVSIMIEDTVTHIRQGKTAEEFQSFKIVAALCATISLREFINPLKR